MRIKGNCSGQYIFADKNIYFRILQPTTILCGVFCPLRNFNQFSYAVESKQIC